MLEEDNLFMNESTNYQNIENNLNSNQITIEEPFSPRKLIHINKKKYESQEKILIEDIEVLFPYKPYEKQITYMKSIIQTLNKKYNSDNDNFKALAALESPTGTGKTLCLLCSILAWVNAKGKVNTFSGSIIYSTRTHSQISQIIDELNKTCYEPRIAILSSREFSCANTELKNSNTPSALDIICAREHKKCKFYNNAEFYSKINFGNVDIEDILKQGKAKKFCPFYAEKIKVKNFYYDIVFIPYNYIFLKEIRENMDIDLMKAILIIDEAHNVTTNCEEAKSLEINIKDFEEMKSDLKSYFKETSKNNINSNEPLKKEEIKDNENEVKKDGDNEFNIYEFEDYNDNMNLKTINNRIGQLKSVVIKEINLVTNIINNLTEKKEIFSLKYINNKGNFIDIKLEDFLSIFISTEEQIKSIKLKLKKNQKTLDSFLNKGVIESNNNEEEDIDYVQLSQFITEQNIKKHIFFLNLIIKDIMNKYSKRTKLSKLLNLIEKIDTIIEDKEKDLINSYVYCLSDEKIQENNYISRKVIKLNIFCFNPGIGFNEIVNFKPYSIILTSGTLAPFDILENELKVKFDTTLENEHIINQSQYKFKVIKGMEINKKNFRFNFEYTNRNNINTIVSLGTIILHLCKSVKNGGILVYFTSFAYLNQCYNIWGENNIISQISKIKTIYFDDKKNKNLIKNFKKNKDKNSILLSVFRGTSSEGIDFKDDFARMVICVGVPYASIVEEKVLLKKKYLDEIKKGDKAMNGKKWYLSDAISNVNQSLGRVLRHIDDYGVLICIDERYEYKNIKSFFSKWIRDKCEVVNNVTDELFDSLLDFFDKQEKEFKEKEKKKNKEKNIIFKNENMLGLKSEDEVKDSNSENNNRSLFENAFKRKKKVIEYNYEESEEKDDIDNNNSDNAIRDKNKSINQDEIKKINNEISEVNYEKDFEILNLKYLSKNNLEENSLLNKKTKLESSIENNEDINPNLLNLEQKYKDENLIPNKNTNIINKKENQNIKDDIKAFVNAIDNFKFESIIKDFNKDKIIKSPKEQINENKIVLNDADNDKIKETLKSLDENIYTKNIKEDFLCNVCYEIASKNPQKKYSQSKCNHILCNLCWSKTLYEKLECPLCRNKVRVKTLNRLEYVPQ